MCWHARLALRHVSVPASTRGTWRQARCHGGLAWPNRACAVPPFCGALRASRAIARATRRWTVEYSALQRCPSHTVSGHLVPKAAPTRAAFSHSCRLRTFPTDQESCALTGQCSQLAGLPAHGALAGECAVPSGRGYPAVPAETAQVTGDDGGCPEWGGLRPHTRLRARRPG